MAHGTDIRWLATGQEDFQAKLQAIADSRHSIRLETYIYTASPPGETLRAALTQAAQRGVRVQVLIDAFGSIELPDTFWEPLRQAGGQVRWFNPLSLGRWGFRDHRKLLVCDEAVAFVGGCNVAPEYTGDGILAGWCDHGARLAGPPAEDLAEAFDVMFARADFRHPRLTRLRRSAFRRQMPHPDCEILLTGPGRGRNPLKKKLHQDLRAARDVQLVSAYFLPTWRIRRELGRVVRRGGRVQILLGAKSDVPVAQFAARSLYGRLMRAGIEIYEYQPQILHAKLLIIDGAAYIGSANLDNRSLHINYELMLRLSNPAAVQGARELFARDLSHALRLEPRAWRQANSLWQKLKQRWAYFLLARVDPLLARRQLRHLDT
ncbi:MAG: phospholipase D-like domain-containing protein [Verrucomicrobiae bacterium]|nr:phospholipase D-like domain-containing protein [Verrucomicrobiae bacterium]